MNYIDAINQRISRRSYLATPIAPEKLEVLQKEIELVNEQSGLTVTFLEDASEAFEGAKSYGMFQGVRSVLVLKGDKNAEHLKEKVGYYGERLILMAQQLDLGTCWVGGTFDKSAKEFSTAENEEIICVVPIGNVGNTTLKEKAMRTGIRRHSKSIEEMIRADRPLTEEETEAMKLVQLAPTARNTQKAVFCFAGSRISAEVPDDSFFDLVDLGICKLHFEEGMKTLFPQGHFSWGNAGVFQTN